MANICSFSMKVKGTKENIEKYEKIDKIFRIENKIGKILLGGFLITMMIGAIYVIFF